MFSYGNTIQFFSTLYSFNAAFLHPFFEESCIETRRMLIFWLSKTKLSDTYYLISIEIFPFSYVFNYRRLFLLLSLHS